MAVRRIVTRYPTVMGSLSILRGIYIYMYISELFFKQTLYFRE